MNSTNKPVHEVRLGSVKAAIWANQTTTGTRHSVTFNRIYKDGDVWKRTESFRVPRYFQWVSGTVG
jgi:hypothetical protein